MVAKPRQIRPAISWGGGYVRVRVEVQGCITQKTSDDSDDVCDHWEEGQPKACIYI